jgi:hypothetical protein
MLYFSISYWDLINFHYFVNTTERGDRGESRAKDADIADNSNMAKIRHPKKKHVGSSTPNSGTHHTHELPLTGSR